MPRTTSSTQHRQSSTAVPTAGQIRRDFLEYFEKKHGHTIVPSAPVVPLDDPTLLFTNAGMNQFKDVFLGQGERPYSRAVDTQKCIRAGGKHNDLEDVGRDTYHHTFFEMLGNWSFGDYFKKEAIHWAWDLLTNVWGLDPSRLHVTVFAGDKSDGLEPDTEAEAIWKELVPAERISRWGKKDNFWEMGDTGPCGPCSEIHYDSTPDGSGAKLVNTGDPNVIEIWNLVFIQFNRDKGGQLTPLPARHVDTGMGFERIVRVLQGKNSNYDTDIWTPIFKAIEQESGSRAYAGGLEDPVDIAYRVLADHVRCLSVAIADGATPGNEGRSYVLRRILRRAVRVARQTLDTDRPLLCRIVPAVVESLGDTFPELVAKQEHIRNVIEREEEAFLRTIDRGIEHFADAAGRAGASKQIGADDAFKLHDTYGFPIDLTCIMAEESGMRVDVDGFDKLMEEARQRSRKTDDADSGMELPPRLLASLKSSRIDPTEDIDKYHGRPITARIRAIWNGSDFDNVISGGRRAAIVLNRTNHYAEQGGQIGDRGTIRPRVEVNAGGGVHDTGSIRGGGTFLVEDTRRFGEYVLHIGYVKDGEIRVDQRVVIDVIDEVRNPIRANHTATHLLNHALRQVIGEEVEQRGSLVANDRLRFDFSCSRALTDKELNGVERLVNASIHQKLTVHTEMVPLEQGRGISGLRAVFGEKYPDPVRIVSIGPPVARLLERPDNPRWKEYSIEFCGGTHLQMTDEARKFIILQEGALAAGVRRITALTGVPAIAAETAARELESRAYRARQLEGRELLEEFDDLSRMVQELTLGTVAQKKLDELLDQLRERVKSFRKQGEQLARETVLDQARTLAEGIQGRLIVDEILGADMNLLRQAMDAVRVRRPEAAVMLFSADYREGKVSMVASVPKEMIAQGLKAGDWVKAAAGPVEGSGGGRPDMAQAGGKNAEGIEEAVDLAKKYAEKTLTNGGS